MKKVVFTILAIILMSSLVSCGQTGTVTVTQTETRTVTETQTHEVTQTKTETLVEKYGQLLKSSKAYNSSPDVSDADIEILVNGNNEFVFDLYRQIISTEDGNLFYSPYSISMAFAMLYAGAGGETKEQMADVFHFDLDDEELNAAFNKLAIELASRGDDEDNFSLNIANAIWGQEGFNILPEFLDTLSENYDAGLRLLDFSEQVEEARQIINDWVSDRTEGRIDELIAEGDLDPSTLLVLTNAIYFKAEWFSPFMEEKTHDAQFRLLDGSTVTVSMMEQVMSFNCTEGSNYQAIELNYKGHDFSMVILLPDYGEFEEFEASLDAQKVDEIINNMDGDAVILSMPKFNYDSDIRLEQILKDMGMPNAFGAADFSGIADNADLYITDAAHKAFISVDELGTEAAAATWVAIAGLTSNEFTMDRPFIYLIRDIETNTILFVGRVMNPAE
jgi:serpin B